MRGNKQSAAIAREWIIKAENDFKNALYSLKMSRGCPTDTVCFHAQQCVEKYLKAFLVVKDIDFPRTHDIEKLVSLLPEDIWLRLSIEEQRRLTSYATVTRYPGEYEASKGSVTCLVADMLARRMTSQPMARSSWDGASPPWTTRRFAGLPPVGWSA
jgi:HEPN domain-containing protein